MYIHIICYNNTHESILSFSATYFEFRIVVGEIFHTIMSDNITEVVKILLAVVPNSRVKCEYQTCLKQSSDVNAEVGYIITSLYDTCFHIHTHIRTHTHTHVHVHTHTHTHIHIDTLQ